MKIFMLLFCCALAIVADAQDNANPVVQSTNGAIKGSILKTRLGKDIYSFRGIRYGEAPIGRNRFKAPVPARPHSGTFDATQDGPSCPQIIKNNRVVSEDCLRLNVYTTTLPQSSARPVKSSNSRRNERLKDVVFYLHHGGFYETSGTTFDLGPQYLLDRDIVLVTINYRLASLGWLSIGDARAPGNAGLKDQILALHWVQQNIRNFGGDPDSVTIMGYSAGSWSISLHMVAPMSRGLFHRAIMMSGSAIYPIPLATEQRAIAQTQAEVLGCPTDTNDNMLECLYTKSTEEYTNSLPKVFSAGGDPVLLWAPVIEQEYYDNKKNEQPFLTTPPLGLIRQRTGNFVPLMIGITEGEFAGAAIATEELAQKGNNSQYDALNNDWERLAPIYVGYERDTPRSHYISREFRKFYLNDEPVGKGRYQGLANLWGDSLHYQAHLYERLMANYSCQPVYNYLFTYPGCESWSKWSNGTIFDVGHQDELLLLFKVGQFPPVCDRDITTLERLTGMVESFAKTGQPIPADNRDYSKVNWEPSTKYHPKYLKIDRELSMENGIIFEDRMNKWDELFPLPSIEEPQECPIPHYGKDIQQHQHHDHHHGHEHHHRHH